MAGWAGTMEPGRPDGPNRGIGRGVLTEPYLRTIALLNTVPGPVGVIAFDSGGNPIDKAMPMLQIQPSGSLTQQDLAWPSGHTLDPKTTC
jgi:hypothetical protein